MLTVGDAIVIINDTIYDDIEIGDRGVIDAINPNWDREVRIKIVGKINNRSGSGLYYVDLACLKKIEDVASDYPKISKKIKCQTGKGVNKMKKLLKGYKIAEVCFANYGECLKDVERPNIDLSKNGYLYALYDNDITDGDIVLCCTGHHGHVIGQVKNVFDFSSEDVKVEYGREIICKIDYSDFEERQAKLKRIDTIKKTMAKKKAELDELAVYELLAKQSPDMAKMLKELKELL